MIAQLARFANDCYHVWKSPTRSKPAILRDLILPGSRKMGFQIAHFDQHTVNYLYREIFARQHYHFNASKSAPVIFDCRANIGMASLYFKWLYPGARVHSFEPDPATFQLLKRNIAQNGLDVQAHESALWDENMELDFHIDPSHPGSLLMSADVVRLAGRPIKVSARKLSDFIEGPVDFLKMDVEGAEHKVLTDLVKSEKIAEIRQMVVEYHHRIGNRTSCLAEFLAMLEHAGFEYQIHAVLYPVTGRDTFQDMLIAGYKA